MNRDDLLKYIAETGYNVGFGAKKHFATYDIVEKIPGLINFLSLAVGTYALVFKNLSAETISATFIVLGIVGLYISFYDSKKVEYENAAIELTQIFNKLKKLYSAVKNSQQPELAAFISQVEALEVEYYSKAISKQILFSDWWAHYKFFWQHQIDWLDEQKKFSFFRDKVPLSLWFTISILVIGCALGQSNFIAFSCAKHPLPSLTSDLTSVFGV